MTSGDLIARENRNGRFLTRKVKKIKNLKEGPHVSANANKRMKNVHTNLMNTRFSCLNWALFPVLFFFLVFIVLFKVCMLL